ncbi:MAG TPA: hypothetical protein VGM80_05330 [Gaiellaceae bacterium]
MIVFILVLGLLVVVAALTFALGAGLVAAIPLVFALGVAGWLGWAFLGGTSPGGAAREAQPADLLGPGGPDDPANTANHGGPQRSSGAREKTV